MSLLPRPFITGIMATAMPAAMRPYSIAVAAVSSRRKALSFPDMSEMLVSISETSVKWKAEKTWHLTYQ